MEWFIRWGRGFGMVSKYGATASKHKPLTTLTSLAGVDGSPFMNFNIS